MADCHCLYLESLPGTLYADTNFSLHGSCQILDVAGLAELETQGLILAELCLILIRTQIYKSRPAENVLHHDLRMILLQTAKLFIVLKNLCTWCDITKSFRGFPGSKHIHWDIVLSWKELTAHDCKVFNHFVSAISTEPQPWTGWTLALWMDIDEQQVCCIAHLHIKTYVKPYGILTWILELCQK